MAKKKKLKITDVQKAFNKAIVRRDAVCRVQDYIHSCRGRLQCSHFFTVGGNSIIRFYPHNAFAQCAGHHMAHHYNNPLFYARYMEREHAEALKIMERVRGKPFHWGQDLLDRIYGACVNDDLSEVERIYMDEIFVDLI